MTGTLKITRGSFFALSCALILFISACKKESAKPKTLSHITTTSFIVDDTAVTNLTHNAFNSSGNFGIIVYGSGGDPELQIVFWGAQTPASGTYIITSGAPALGKCTFTFSNSKGASTATYGAVNITWNGGTNNVCSFSNITVGGSGGNHTVQGTVTY